MVNKFYCQSCCLYLSRRPYSFWRYRTLEVSIPIPELEIVSNERYVNSTCFFFTRLRIFFSHNIEKQLGALFVYMTQKMTDHTD